MAKRITIDPITRIEGHMILQGRDPRDAPLFTQRSCGV
jgi:Ni,Fe-hydrogenase I large subunit